MGCFGSQSPAETGVCHWGRNEAGVLRHPDPAMRLQQ